MGGFGARPRESPFFQGPDNVTKSVSRYSSCEHCVRADHRRPPRHRQPFQFSEVVKQSPAVAAGERFPFRRAHDRLRSRAEEQANPAPGLVCGAAQKAVVAQSGKPFREDVNQPATNELMRRQEHDRGLAGSAASPSQADAALLVVTKKALRGKRTAMHVTGEIAQCGDAFASVLELHIPLLLRLEDAVLLWGQSFEDLGVLLLECGLKAISEPCRERPEVNKKSVFVRTNELVPSGGQSNGGNNAVDVGMVLHLTSPGVEDGRESRGSALVLGGDDIGKRPGAFTQKDVVECFREGKTERPQLRRYREGDHEIGNREEAGFLFGTPELLIEGTALRAVAMIAAVVGEVMFSAVTALVELPAEFGSAAREDAPHRPVVGGAEPGAVGGGVAPPMLPQKIGESERHGGRDVLSLCQGIASVSRAIRAFSSLISVRWR